MDEENEIAQLRSIIKARDKEMHERDLLLKASFAYVRRHYKASHAGTGQAAWALMNQIQDIIGFQQDDD